MLQPLWHFDRRELFRHLGLGLMGSTCASWLPALAEQVAADPRRKRHRILLWMSGGPPQTDTFDMKPGHNNGGEFKEVATRAPGLRFSEHLPKLAADAMKQQRLLVNNPRAVGEADAREALLASRTRIVRAADGTRRLRIAGTRLAVAQSGGVIKKRIELHMLVTENIRVRRQAVLVACY